jgi:uncharacterized membrane protein YccF (DUF307 family)
VLAGFDTVSIGEPSARLADPSSGPATTAQGWGISVIESGEFQVIVTSLAAYVLWPFGRTVIRRPGAGAASMVGNVLWFLLAGVWIAIAHVFLGLILCLTIVGIPLGLGNFKLAAVAIAPLGKEIVSTSDPRAALGAVSF